QVVQRSGIQDAQNRGLDASPDPARQAYWLTTTGARQVILSGAVDGCHFTFQDAVHVADRDCLWDARQSVPASNATCAFNQAGAPQLANELLEVGHGQVLFSGDLRDGQELTLAVRPG